MLLRDLNVVEEFIRGARVLKAAASVPDPIIIYYWREGGKACLRVGISESVEIRCDVEWESLRGLENALGGDWLPNRRLNDGYWIPR